MSVGRDRADPVAPQTEDYIGRIRKFLQINTTSIKPAANDRVLERLKKETQKSDVVVAMDERGKMYDSDAFARLVESWMNAGISEVSFVIGGAEGLPKEFKKRADVMISLSKMTFPHRLARLFLAEQLYRALCEIRNIPYKK